MAYPENANTGMFLPTTFIMDTDDQKELIVRLYQNLGFICNTVNLKDTGYYALEEFNTGQSFFPDPALNSSTPQTPTFRNAFRKVINFGALPNTATKSVAHGISVTANTTWTNIRATATDPVALTSFPIPTTGTTITVNATNVNITTGSNLSAYSRCIIVLEYLKQ